VLGPYRLLEQVSAGRSAVVFRAWHARLPVPVAVKVLLADEPVDRAYLRNEAAVLAWVHHPNIVRLWDFDEDGPFPFLVTEFAEGQTLGRFIEQHGRLDPRWVMQVVYFVAQGLLAASDVGVIHRDVKPANILILSSGQVKVCDFGLATVTSQQLRGVTPVPPAGGLLGTPAYVAPEQARDPQRVDARTDIYSLGATAWHALTGRLPFDGRSCLEVVYKHINELPVPPVRLVPSLPSAISDLVLKMMAPRPQDRPQSFAELLRALAECLR
jgi:serine/threonine protein kinase